MHDIFNEVFGDVFGDMFGGGRGGQQRSGPARGQDLRYDLEITLEQAYAGAEVEITVPIFPQRSQAFHPGERYAASSRYVLCPHRSWAQPGPQ